jgi:hypothetical protein
MQSWNQGVGHWRCKGAKALYGYLQWRGGSQLPYSPAAVHMCGGARQGVGHWACKGTKALYGHLQQGQGSPGFFGWWWWWWGGGVHTLLCESRLLFVNPTSTELHAGRIHVAAAKL